MDRLEELNKECEKCLADATKRFESVDRIKCAEFCPIGRKIHELEVNSSSKWNDVDWNTSKFEDLYHH